MAAEIQNEKQKPKKSREAYERKFTIPESKVDKNLKSNLLLIRESFRAFQKVPPCSINISMEIFYRALGLYVCDESEDENIDDEKIKKAQTSAIRKASDIYSKFIDDIPNSRYFDSMQKGLIDAGIPERFVRKNRTARMLIAPEIDCAVDKYFAKKTANSINDIQLNLMQKYLERNKNVCELVMFVYKLINRVLPNETHDLYTANEALEKVLENDLPEYVKNSSSYAEYITTLAKSVIKIEDEFPNFYALTQQMKQEKTPQSIMNETTKALQQLQNDMKISRSDAESESCQNMMNEIAKLMLIIQQALTP